LQAARDKLRAEVENARREQGELAARLDDIYSRLRTLTLGDMGSDGALSFEECQAAGAVFLREAIVEIADHFERSGEERSGEEPSTTAAAPQPQAEPAGEHPSASSAPALWSAEGVCIGAVDSTPGVLSIGEAYLSWVADGTSDEACQHVLYQEVLHAAAHYRRSPHHTPSTCNTFEHSSES